MRIFYVAQLVIPAALLLSLFLFPPRYRISLILLLLGTGLWLAAIYFAGIWLVLPRWLVAVYLVALGIGGWRAWRRKMEPWQPHRRRNWSGALIGCLSGLLAALVLLQYYQAQTPPNGPVVALANPLVDDSLFVASGGYSSATNGGHHMTLDQGVPRFRDFFGQSMAVDLVQRGFWGRTTNGIRPSDPAAYAIFGDAVVAPCDGTVIAARNDQPDNQVPEMNRSVMLGNHVILQCGAYHIVLAHFRQGSVVVTLQDQVTTGQQLGEVGNSGNSSEPHLHIHAQSPGTPDAPVSGVPLPITIGGRYLVRNDRP